MFTNIELQNFQEALSDLKQASKVKIKSTDNQPALKDELSKTYDLSLSKLHDLKEHDFVKKLLSNQNFRQFEAKVALFYKKKKIAHFSTQNKQSTLEDILNSINIDFPKAGYSPFISKEIYHYFLKSSVNENGVITFSFLESLCIAIQHYNFNISVPSLRDVKKAAKKIKKLEEELLDARSIVYGYMKANNNIHSYNDPDKLFIRLDIGSLREIKQNRFHYTNPDLISYITDIKE